MPNWHWAEHTEKELSSPRAAIPSTQGQKANDADLREESFKGREFPWGLSDLSKASIAPEPDLFRALPLIPIPDPPGFSPNAHPVQAQTWAFKVIGGNKHLVTSELDVCAHVFSDLCAFLSKVSELVMVLFQLVGVSLFVCFNLLNGCKDSFHNGRVPEHHKQILQK